MRETGQPESSGAGGISRPRPAGDPLPGRSRGRIHLGTVAGIAIGLDYSWFIIFGVLLLWFGTGYFPSRLPDMSSSIWWALALIAALLFFGSVIVHELAHSIVARINGIPIEGIDLFIFGGVSKLQEEPQSPGVEFKMAIVGPLASFVLAACFYVVFQTLGPTSKPLEALTGYLAFINGALGVFNLLPGLPLDGGRVLRALIWHRTGNLRHATRVAASTGQFLGYALIGWGIFSIFIIASAGGIWLAFIGWFLLQAAQASYQQLLVRESIAGVKVHQLMSATPPIVPANISLQDAIDNYFMEYAATVFPVMQGETFLGLLSVEEVRKVDRAARPHITAGEVATPVDEDLIVAPNDDALVALGKFGRHSGGLLVVISESRLVGILSQQDMLRHIQLRLQLG